MLNLTTTIVVIDPAGACAGWRTADMRFRAHGWLSSSGDV
jgi:hypothetical protein